VDLLESAGVRTISLADTVGLAGPAQIRELFSAVNSKFDYLEIGVHLHSRPDQAAEKVLAAYDAAAAVLIRHWADWVDAPSRKTPWWEISPPKASWKRCNKEERSCRR